MTDFEIYIKNALCPRPPGYVVRDYDHYDPSRDRPGELHFPQLLAPVFAVMLGAANVTIAGGVTVAQALAGIAFTSVTNGISRI